VASIYYMFISFSFMIFLLCSNLSLIYVISGILIFLRFLWQILKVLSYNQHISSNAQSILNLCNRWHSYIFTFPMWLILKVLSYQVTISDIYIICLQVSHTGQSILKLCNMWYSYIFTFPYNQQISSNAYLLRKCE
jgi:ABC-type transport system involved in Fe-S cluster assembly fused permease/ATPase subunit